MEYQPKRMDDFLTRKTGIRFTPHPSSQRLDSRVSFPVANLKLNPLRLESGFQFS